jgi:hypothetical protein
MYVSRVAQYADVLLVSFFVVVCMRRQRQRQKLLMRTLVSSFLFNDRNLDFFGFVLRFARPI